MAFHLDPTQQFLVQTHFNRGGDRARADVVLHRAEKRAAQYAGGILGFYKGLRIPSAGAPGRPPTVTTVSTRCKITGDADEGRGPVTVMSLEGHYHLRGTRLDVYKVLADGTRGPRVFDAGYSDEQLFAQYDARYVRPATPVTPLPIELTDPGDPQNRCPRLNTTDGIQLTDRTKGLVDFSSCPSRSSAHFDPVVLQPGEGLEWECTYVNNSCNQSYGTTSEHIEGCRDFTTNFSATFDEHCNLFGTYYPTKFGKQEDITCIRNDGFGVDGTPGSEVPLGSVTRCVSGSGCTTTPAGQW